MDYSLQDGKIGKVVYEGTHVCLSTILLRPLSPYALASLTHYLHRCQERLYLKASCKYYGIKIFPLACLADDTSICELLDSLWQQINIRTVQRGEIPWIKNSPFAAERKIWYDEVMVLLWCLSIDVLLCFIFNRMPLLDLLWFRAIYRREMISVEENFQTVVSLPEWNVAEAKPFEACEVVVWSFVIPLWASSIPVAVSVEESFYIIIVLTVLTF